VRGDVVVHGRVRGGGVGGAGLGWGSPSRELSPPARPKKPTRRNPLITREATAIVGRVRRASSSRRERFLLSAAAGNAPRVFRGSSGAGGPHRPAREALEHHERFERSGLGVELGGIPPPASHREHRERDDVPGRIIQLQTARAARPRAHLPAPNAGLTPTAQLAFGEGPASSVFPAARATVRRASRSRHRCERRSEYKEGSADTPIPSATSGAAGSARRTVQDRSTSPSPVGAVGDTVEAPSP